MKKRFTVRLNDISINTLSSEDISSYKDELIQANLQRELYWSLICPVAKHKPASKLVTYLIEHEVFGKPDTQN